MESADITMRHTQHAILADATPPIFDRTAMPARIAADFLFFCIYYVIEITGNGQAVEEASGRSLIVELL
jgi:hypothetical protein